MVLQKSFMTASRRPVRSPAIVPDGGIVRKTKRNAKDLAKRGKREHLMKGKILGFTPSTGTGTIAGDNDERFTFVATQWRSDRPIGVGVTVDFAPIAGVATEIYPVAGGAFGGADMAGLAASPLVRKARVLGTSTLAFPLAILLLLATFLPVLSVNTLGTLGPMAPAGAATGVSLWRLGGLDRMLSANPILSADTGGAADRLARIDKEENELRAELARRSIPVPTATEIAAARSTNGFMFFNGAPIASQLKGFAEDRAKYEQQLSDGRWRGLISGLLVVRFLVPLGACLLLWLAWSGKPVAKPSIVVGAAALAAGVLVYLYRDAVIGKPDKGTIGGAIAQQMDAVLSIGIGTWALILIGLALLGAGSGLIRNPLADRV